MKINSVSGIKRCKLSDSALNNILGGGVNYGCATGSGTFHGISYSADSTENYTNDSGETYDRTVRHVSTDASPYKDVCKTLFKK